MIPGYQKITIIKSLKPSSQDINEALQWFGTSLGLFSIRDKDSSCFRIFIELLKSAKKKTPLSSEQIARKLNLSRGTVIHHLNKLLDSGLVCYHKNRYVLRVNKLELLVEEIEKDIIRSLEDMREIAREIDNWIGL